MIPKEHIASVAELSDDNRDIAARCLVAAGKIAAREGLAGGYRIVSNCGDDAGQTVKHLHFHILGGMRLNEQMGCKIHMSFTGAPPGAPVMASRCLKG